MNQTDQDLYKPWELGFPDENVISRSLNRIEERFGANEYLAYDDPSPALAHQNQLISKFREQLCLLNSKNNNITQSVTTTELTSAPVPENNVPSIAHNNSSTKSPLVPSNRPRCRIAATLNYSSSPPQTAETYSKPVSRRVAPASSEYMVQSTFGTKRCYLGEAIVDLHEVAAKLRALLGQDDDHSKNQKGSGKQETNINKNWTGTSAQQPVKSLDLLNWTEPKPGKPINILDSKEFPPLS